ncbi:MAG: hypothetical protein J5I91_01865 [Bacteroidetes bacterium]|nr:hypothetical protein [Bacteroidota bacterium]
MKTNALKTTTSLLLLSLIAGSINSCKKNEKNQEKEIPLEGRYKVEVKVTKRLPLMSSVPENIDSFPYTYKENFYNQNQRLLDTGANVCCESFGPWNQWYKRNCPPLEYVITGLEIVKENGVYCFKSEWYDGIGRKISFSLPLTLNGDKVSYDLLSDLGEERRFTWDTHKITTNTENGYPYGLRMLSLNLEKKREDGALVGIWIFQEHSSCKILFPVSGVPYDYSLVEFAEVTFTKIKD